MKGHLTEGSVRGTVLRFSLPYLLSCLLQSLYGMADLYVMGRYADTAGTTAVSVGSQVMHVITVLLMGLAMGTTVTTARARGAQAKGTQNAAEERTNRAFSQAVGNSATLFGGVSLGLTVLLLCLVRPVTVLMSTPAEAIPACTAYLTVCFVGIPCITAYNIVSAVYRAAGDPLTPLLFVGTACVCNVGLDFC